MTYLVQRDVSSKPSLILPELACDCHAHIFGTPDAYPFAATRGYTPPPAPVSHYLAMAATVGLERVVIVQPSVYGYDNRCTLDAVEQNPRRYSRRVDVLPPADVVAEIDDKVDMAAMERVLMEEGIRKFADPQKALLGLIAGKREAALIRAARLPPGSPMP